MTIHPDVFKTRREKTNSSDAQCKTKNNIQNEPNRRKVTALRKWIRRFIFFSSCKAQCKMRRIKGPDWNNTTIEWHRSCVWQKSTTNRRHTIAQYCQTNEWRTEKFTNAKGETTALLVDREEWHNICNGMLHWYGLQWLDFSKKIIAQRIIPRKYRKFYKKSTAWSNK